MSLRPCCKQRMQAPAQCFFFRGLPRGLAFWLLAALTTLICPAQAQLKYRGVNLCGAEFGGNHLPGTYGRHYIYPTPQEVDYFRSRGMNTFRIPFLWERMQRRLRGPLNEEELARLEKLVRHITGHRCYAILDPHNYARYRGHVIGGRTVSAADFADFWRRLAVRFKHDPRVIFGLMNEPHDMPTAQWVAAANRAIAAIRAAGANNLVLVPGNSWSGAHSWHQNWYGEPNARAMLRIRDPAGNFAYEVHQYLDRDSSGRTSQVVSPTVGVERLRHFTRWLRRHRRKGFLGEFAAANVMIGPQPHQIGDEAITAMLRHLEQNRDVWIGWTWWAAGPWWKEYRFTLEPTPEGKDRPAMRLLAPWLKR